MRTSKKKRKRKAENEKRETVGYRARSHWFIEDPDLVDEEEVFLKLRELLVGDGSDTWKKI